MIKFVVAIPVYLLILFINIYRVTLSPFFGNQCRFYPTCSHYAEKAIKHHGAARGMVLAAKRILRCHPWHEGGYDPVPENQEKDHSGELNLG